MAGHRIRIGLRGAATRGTGERRAAACADEIPGLTAAGDEVGLGGLQRTRGQRQPATTDASCRRWAVVVRVSHMGARRSGAEDFHSERDQIRAAKDAVEARGGTADVLPSELDVSGGNDLDERPSLKQALEGVEAGEYCGIAVAYQSRLSRNPELEEAVFRRVEKAGGEIIMAMEPLDTATVEGRMLRRVRSAFNASERERHAERFEDLRQKATEAGIWQRRQIPTGYTRDPVTRKLIPSDDAPKVLEAFRRRAGGATITDIARLVGLTQSGTRALLRNRLYLGELRVGQHVNPDAHDAIVPVDVWEAAQIPYARPARGTYDGPALVGGLVRCQACGHVLSRARTGAIVYAHPLSSHAAACPAKATVTLHRLDTLIEAIALQELRRLSLTARESGGAVTAAQKAVTDADRELALYLQAVSVALVGPDAFAEGARQRRVAVDDARAVLRQAISVQPAVPALEAGDEAWHVLNAHERNTLLRGLIEVVVVRSAGGRGSRVPLEDRVRVIAYGAGVYRPPRVVRGEPVGVRPIEWLDVDDPRVLRVAGGQDRG
jgi:DNA invertase Pin-like site-specific DNA recombinase